ncbi:MAG TPA: hypothetical protein VGL88_07875 [Pseudonocardiaceae bacterium]|jgi:hypothetical protein
MTSQPFQPAPPSITLPTGIAEALADLRDLDELATGEHVARLRAVHDSLAAALASIDEV